MKTLQLIFLTLVILLFTGCGGEQAIEGATKKIVENFQEKFLVEKRTGVFSDAAIEGLPYTCSTEQGTTDAQGRFNYIEGEPCVFYFGTSALTIDSEKLSGASAKITPFDVKEFQRDPDRAVKFMQLIQTLDNPNDKNINLTKIRGKAIDLRTALADETSLQRAVDSVKDDFNEKLENLVSAVDAMKHFLETHSEDKTILENIPETLFEDLDYLYLAYEDNHEEEATEDDEDSFEDENFEEESEESESGDVEEDSNEDTDIEDTIVGNPNAGKDAITSENLSDEEKLQKSQAIKFLNRATFGAKESSIKTYLSQNPSQWILNEFNKPATYYLSHFERLSKESYQTMPITAFWLNAITAEDQLRQRMAYALSQIFVISTNSDILEDEPYGVGYFQDILVKHAFGNYRELLEAVTYSPAMAEYLTYIESKKADPITGQRPDENYAREILQLFSIGLVRLHQDGSVVLDADSQAIETYSNKDIMGLAKVFTGLVLNDNDIDEESDYTVVFNRPLAVNAQEHSTTSKEFLGLTIPANTSSSESIKRALDYITAHQNVPPFIARQLIQRFVTSHPTPAYIKRVADAFASGSYTLPNGVQVGAKKRGDLKATIAAVLMDTEAQNVATTFGKVKEPVLRFTQWARAFDVEGNYPQNIPELAYTSEASSLGQQPFKSPSVFNFYRPGYIAPKTLTGARKLTAPELQIVNATTITGYTNFMTFFVYGWMSDPEYVEETKLISTDEDTNLDATKTATSFYANYTNELALINDSRKLVEHLDLILTGSTLKQSTKTNIIETIDLLDQQDSESSLEKVQMAVMMVVTSPEYIVQY